MFSYFILDAVGIKKNGSWWVKKKKALPFDWYFVFKKYKIARHSKSHTNTNCAHIYIYIERERERERETIYNVNIYRVLKRYYLCIDHHRCNLDLHITTTTELTNLK